MITRGPLIPRSARGAPLLVLALAVGMVAFVAAVLGVASLRLQNQEAFIWGSRLLDPVWGVSSAGVLLLGSVLFVLAGFMRRAGILFGAAMFYALTLLLAFNYVTIRSIEWLQLSHEFQRLESTSLAGSATLSPGAGVSTASGEALAPVASSLRPGDAELGAPLFRGTCASCHGLAGQGVDRQGSPLATSAFAMGLDDLSLVDFIKKGRTPNDPQSTLGMLMPPRGGNTRLSDQNLADVVAFIRTLQKSGAASASGASGGGAPATNGLSAEEIEIARSVLAPTLRGPEGTAEHVLGRAEPVAVVGAGVSALGTPDIAPAAYQPFRRAFLVSVAVQIFFVLLASGVVTARMVICLIPEGAGLAGITQSPLAESMWHLTSAFSIFILLFCYFTEWF